jgi:HTH-like domain
MERDILGKSHGLLRQRERDPLTDHRFIAAEKANLPIKVMCEVLGVSRSSVYEREHREPSNRAVCDAGITMLIKDIHTQSRGTYGAPRVHAALARKGVRCGRKRVARLMRAEGLQGGSPSQEDSDDHPRSTRPRSGSGRMSQRTSRWGDAGHRCALGRGGESSPVFKAPFRIGQCTRMRGPQLLELVVSRRHKRWS